MSLLWAGVEDISILPSGYLQSWGTATATAYRSAYARAGYWARQNATSWNYGNAFPGGAIATGWLTVRAYMNWATSQKPIGLCDQSTGKGIFIGSSASGATKVAVWKYDGASWSEIATESGTSLTANLLQKLDLYIAGFGASVNVKVYVGGSSVAAIDTNVDTTVAGITGWNCVGFPIQPNNTCNLSEVGVADEDTRTWNILTMAPSGAGGTNDWDGDGSGGIDEAAMSDADMVYTNTADEDCQVALTDTPAGTFGVAGILVVARACKSSDATIQTLELGMQSSGSVDVDAGHVLSTAWAHYERIMATINGGAITTAILDAAQLDLQSET